MTVANQQEHVLPGKKGRSGGARAHAGRPPNSVRNAEDRRALALAASEYTMEALATMVELMRTGDSDAVRLMAASRILDRAVGKAPLNIDVTALRHTEIVYESVMEIRRELERRGVPPILIEHLASSEAIDAPPSEPSDSATSAQAAN